MSSLFGSSSGSGDRPVSPLGVIAEERMEQQVRILQISQMLHRKLNLHLLLECFYTESQSFVKYEGLSFTATDDSETLLTGNKRQHHRKYDMQLGGESLGELVVQSAHPLAPREQRELDRLVASMEYPLKNALDYRVAERASLVDGFTGIFNKAALDRELPREMLLSRRGEQPLSLLVIDLDHFKQINVSHGYEVGDELILQVARTLTSNLRETDVIFRLQQDSFAVILGDTDFDGAQTVSERLRTSVDTCYAYSNIQLLQNASAGVTEMVDTDTADSLLARAGSALLNAKRAGRNRIRSLQAESALSQ